MVSRVLVALWLPYRNNAECVSVQFWIGPLDKIQHSCGWTTFHLGHRHVMQWVLLFQDMNWNWSRSKMGMKYALGSDTPWVWNLTYSFPSRKPTSHVPGGNTSSCQVLGCPDLTPLSMSSMLGFIFILAYYYSRFLSLSVYLSLCLSLSLALSLFGYSPTQTISCSLSLFIQSLIFKCSLPPSSV